jgi:flagellar biosynthetic protein FliR
MNWIFQHYLSQFVIFTLVLSRVSGLLMTAPIYGTTEVPARIRGLLAFSLALLITPLQTLKLANPPQTLIDFALLVGGEILVGVTIGVGITILFSGVQVAGQVISQMSGLQMADVYNPGFDSSVSVFSQLLFYVALGVFVIIDGHRRVMGALLDTFSWLPPGGSGMPETVTETLTTLIAQSFVLGVRAAAPAMAALLVATLILGLISRTLPQLNIMTLGFGLNSLITLGAICLSIGTVAWTFQDQVEPVLTSLLEALRG